jgi:hypothetical protein
LASCANFIGSQVHVILSLLVCLQAPDSTRLHFSNSLSGGVDKYEHQQDDLVALMGLKFTNHKVLYVSYNSHWVLHRCQKSIPSLRSSSLEDSLMERDLLLSPDKHCD